MNAVEGSIHARPRAAFILSTTRGGSIWLCRVLGAHSWAEGLGEYGRLFFAFRNQPPCRQCVDRGLPRCEMLEGVEAVAPDDAMHFASARASGRTIIDASKRLSWAMRFIDRRDLDVRLVHLVRHPCGFVESEGRRRQDLGWEALYAEWELQHRKIAAFIARQSRPAIRCLYDDLADDPGAHFPRLCENLGGAWEPEALRYWEKPQHGPGGNGASSLYLSGSTEFFDIETGDDAFYATMRSTRTRADRRWRDRLSPDVQEAIQEKPYARELLAELRGEGAPL